MRLRDREAAEHREEQGAASAARPRMTSPPTGSRDISADEISSSRRLARGVGKARARAGDAGVGGRALPSQARSSPPREQRPLTAQACQSGRAHTPQQQAEIDPVLDSEWARAHAETGEREARRQAEGASDPRQLWGLTLV